MRRLYSKKKTFLLTAASAFVLSCLFCILCISEIDFSIIEKRSRIITDTENNIIGYTLSEDTDSYRFLTKSDEVAEVYLKMLLANEDQNFYHHFGVDLPAIFRSAWDNAAGQKVMSPSKKDLSEQNRRNHLCRLFNASLRPHSGSELVSDFNPVRI